MADTLAAGRAAHTSGPWSHNSKGRVIAPTGLVAICKTDRAKADGALLAAAPELLQALEYAAELVKTARAHFPKSIRNRDKFQLENTCATIGKAIHHAKGGV